jgi:hypothetical protein
MLYREKDIEQIKINMDNIVDNATLVAKKTIEPTIDESNNIYKDILDFIKKKKRIIYGGYAQNSLIKKKNINDGFYRDAIDTPDIEFYSFEPLKDLYELCRMLYDKKYKYVTSTEGVHEGTYKIFVNFQNYCDISYLPKNIYDNLQYIEYNNLRCCHPNFMLIDIYRVFTDPMTSYWRLNKSFTRYLRLYKYYPLIENKNNIIKFQNITNDNILKMIRVNIIHDSKYIVVGSYAYNYYIKKLNESSETLIKINYYELIVENLNIEGNIIYQKLKKVLNNITVKEYYPFFEFFDYKIEYLYNDKVILCVYNNNNRCVVYNKSEKKRTYFGTNQLVLLYLLINHIYYIVNRNSIESNNYYNMFIKLNNAKIKYLNKHDITVLDFSPFQDFKINCIGKTIPVDRLERLNIIKKKSQGKNLKFKYEPSDKILEAPEYVFSNSSGNQVTNEKKLIIKI